MIEIKHYINCNVKLIDAKPKDKQLYYQIKKETCEKYVKKYFGGWKEHEQREYNNKIFDDGKLIDRFYKEDN